MIYFSQHVQGETSPPLNSSFQDDLDFVIECFDGQNVINQTL